MSATGGLVSLLFRSLAGRRQSMRWCRMGAWADVKDAIIGRFTHVVRSRRHWDIRRDCLPQRLLVAHLSARRGGGGSRERG
ncbi:MAG: hypothetical protein QOJ59_5629, partial [Thermomicrobiales bacterium]|nr:hypothetical protein [Thermomicrobiales bacterium]